MRLIFLKKFSGTTIKDAWTKPRGRVEAGEGGELTRLVLEITVREGNKPWCSSKVLSERVPGLCHYPYIAAD